MQKGLSRGELAHLAGLSEKQVGLIERGKARNPRAETIFNLAQVLDVDVFSLFPVEKRFRR